MVRCKRYSGLIKKIQGKIENSSLAASDLTISERFYDFLGQPIISLKDVELPDQITAIVKQNDDNARHTILTKLFLHVVRLFQKLNGRMETERDKLL
jgi:hypothetical protein